MDRKGEKRRDPVNYLSDDVIRHILSMMRMREIARVSTLSREWRRIVLSLPFLNVDLDAFHFSDAPSKLQELNEQHPLYLRLYHSNSIRNTSRISMIRPFQEDGIYGIFLRLLKKKCLHVWTSRRRGVREELVVELVEIVCERFFGGWREFEVNVMEEKDRKISHLKIFNELKEMEMELATEHFQHDLGIIGIIAEALVNAKALKELTIVHALYPKFAPDARKGCKLQRGTYSAHQPYAGRGYKRQRRTYSAHHFVDD